MSGPTYDVAVIGAGPAGLAAASAAAGSGLNVCLLDEQRSPGGQIYRAIETSGLKTPAILGSDYAEGADIVRRFRTSGATYQDQAMVWMIDRTDEGFDIAFSLPGGQKQISAKRLIVATGAMERPVPVPGWTLPGVMSAGAAQILLKQSGITPSGGIVLAGSGPLLFLLASQYVKAGVKITAILETTTLRDRIYALQHLPKALRGGAYLRKGLAMLSELRRAGVPILSGIAGLSVIGGKSAEQVRFTHRGLIRQMVADTIVLHEGVIPNTQLPMALGCRMIWDKSQLCWRPELGRFGLTSEAGIYVAGDGGGIDGAKSAALSGELAGLGVVQDIDKSKMSGNSSRAADLEKKLEQDRTVRPFLERLYRPHFSLPADEAIVCRCEEITAGEVRRIAASGCPGPNQMKSFCRAGMGPCQGRMCSLTVTRLMADVQQTDPSEIGHYRIRMPVKPVTVAEMAQLAGPTE